jgi:hypothetical protein
MTEYQKKQLSASPTTLPKTKMPNHSDQRHNAKVQPFDHKQNVMNMARASGTMIDRRAAPGSNWDTTACAQ